MQNLSNFDSLSQSQLQAFSQQNPLRFLSFQYTENDLHSFNYYTSVYKIEKRYRILKQIGFGFNPTFTAIDQEYGQKVIIEVIKIENDDLIYMNQLIRQIKIENHFKHENISSNLHIMMESKNLYIVREFIDTDLHRVNFSKQELTDDHIQYFTYQILSALFFLHSQNVYHTQLRLSNILLNKNCDLKISRFIGTNFPNEIYSQYITSDYFLSPQQILNLPKNLSKTDIWHVGVIILGLINRDTFFSNLSNQLGGGYLGLINAIFSYIGTPSGEELLQYQDYKGLYQYIIKYSKKSWQDVFPDANPLLCDLLDKMLVFNEDKRYTVKECLQHPYFEDLYDLDDIDECDVKFDHSQFQIGLNEDEIMKEIYFEVEKSYQKQQKQKLKRYQIQIIQNIAFQKHLADQIPLNPKLIFYNLYEDL
ncbi:cyclin-dependent kinase-like Serine/Threonine kinase family protein (macronuclear) [Tetrahymena thermophila SB210]|uniref:Cyclin-dependent kinase-like Serine/Threonine kinase family protein n=1 Tax=Tetrahymena thermophila (strain SB210) TaxID=312017 RepID=Q22ND2_TETTS|nr:cyclin-dependent kinase-like Serine/Threonine kinase family protein [Tetrahymena thermophila SB210]EAR86853.1 cyclin-dependent kinase-like Serine/Threonine kinase family protein [Tetrahymena thermophila SB210]|eukprot:XP_001007098.1 cyclin-dependent kinase-like Serine/Threonine kinase family protein [Tetrahymena thermophila SB210]